MVQMKILIRFRKIALSLSVKKRAFLYAEMEENMNEYEVNMLSFGCGDCMVCPYNIKCNEYIDYMKFVMGAHKEEQNSERA